jgi:hypothetical protein
LIYAAVCTGERFEALTSLRWGQVDLDRRRVIFLAGTRKGSTRDIERAVTPQLAAMLAEHRRGPGDLVWPWDRATRSHWASLQVLCRSAGVEYRGRGFHGFRRMAASYAALAGGAAAALSAEVQSVPFGLVLDRGRFRTADRGAAIQVAGAACLAAAGSAKPPRSAALGALCERLSGAGAVHATLAGALILADGARILWTRSPGEARRSGVVDLELEAGETGVFDGRFEVVANRSARVSLLAGKMSRLEPQARAALAAAPAPCRGALPAVVSEGEVRLAGTPGSGVQLRPLARARLVSACGGVATEAGVAALEASLRD